MKKTLNAAFVVLVFAMPASALDIEAITTQPTANSPQFDNNKA